MIPVITVAAFWLRLVKFLGLKNFIYSKEILDKVGIMPIVDHYYEPFYFREKFGQKERIINHLKIDKDSQLALIEKISFAHEINQFAIKEKSSRNIFYYENNTFSYGDAELYYSIIRHYKPKTVCEIGSGFSTLVAYQAVNKNKKEGQLKCELLCIEPYENEWLEELPVKVIRNRVEDIDISIFEKLEGNDVLFIDSSHVIKPGGDVLREVFDILPSLKKGVLIHFHDIFLPQYYPDKWVNDEFRLWNEQYLVEAFLSYNNSFEIVVSLSWLMRDRSEGLRKLFSNLPQDAQPSSLWVRKIR